MSTKAYVIDSYSISALHANGELRSDVSIKDENSILRYTRQLEDAYLEGNVPIRCAFVEEKLTLDWPQRKISKMLARKDILAIEAITKLIQKNSFLDSMDSFRKGVFSSVSDCFLQELFNYADLFTEKIDLDSGEYDNYAITDLLLNSINPMSIPKFLHNNTACFGSFFSGAMGVNAAIADGETSGSELMSLAIRAIDDGELDIALVGASSVGVEEFRISSYVNDSVRCSSNSDLGNNSDFFNESCSFSIIASEAGVTEILSTGANIGNVIEIETIESVVLPLENFESEFFKYINEKEFLKGILCGVDFVLSDFISSRKEIKMHRERISDAFSIDTKNVFCPRYLFGNSYEAQANLSLSLILESIKNKNHIFSPDLICLERPLTGVLISTNDLGKVCVMKTKVLEVD